MLNVVVKQAKDFLTIMSSEIPMSQKIKLLVDERVVHSYEELYYTISKYPPDEQEYDSDDYVFDAQQYLEDCEEWLREVEMELMLYYPKWLDIINGGDV